MDFAFSEAQEAVRDLSRKIFQEKLTPEFLKKLEHDDPDRFASSVWKELATTGLLGTALPEAHGGSDHGLPELMVLLQEAGAAVAPLPLFATLACAAMPIAHFGSDAQKEELLPGVIAGEFLLTAGLEEPHHASALAPQTKATMAAGGYNLSGVKVMVPFAHVAKRILIPAQVEGKGIALFLLDPKAPGVTLERGTHTNGEPVFEIQMKEAHVPDSQVLVGPEQGEQALRWLVQRAQVCLSVMELGVCEKALRITADYVTNRKQFERPIATFQAVSQRTADAFIDIECMRLATWHAGWQLAEGKDADESVAMAKFLAAEAGHRVVYAAQHLHGGMGFDLDYPIHRYYLWSKRIELTLGSGTHHLLELGAQMAKETQQLQWVTLNNSRLQQEKEAAKTLLPLNRRVQQLRYFKVISIDELSISVQFFQIIARSGHKILLVEATKIDRIFTGRLEFLSFDNNNTQNHLVKRSESFVLI
jgi:3-oxocholest-4-en-26-oyl-CoA dehydrogenase beta subunit